MTKNVDSEHSSKLLKLKTMALQGNSKFSDWARRSETEQQAVYGEILKKLGNLPVQNSWSVFAKIYNEDTPDSVFIEAVKFIRKIFNQNGVKSDDLILDVACGTGSVSRLLAKADYTNIVGIDKSPQMLNEARMLSGNFPQIKFKQSEIVKLKNLKAKGAVWLDFSSNFALTEKSLRSWLQAIIENLDKHGILIFDIRTKTGWNINFFKQRVTAYETDNFQRLWINLKDEKKSLITFDIFIRTKNKNGKWLLWKREQMTERMWSLDEVIDVVDSLTGVNKMRIYSDNFTLLKKNKSEPGLAYFVLRKG